MIFADVLEALDITLVDISPKLIEIAAEKFLDAKNVRIICANVNELNDVGYDYDIVVMVSSLHHIVELESLLRDIKMRLADSGEFWILGEYVGRKGNRLYPEAAQIANDVFRSLPDKYRKNSASSKIDERIPDGDCSLGCFEGIRSDEILDVLRRHFRVVDEYVRNCFLWRLLNLSYSKNYDLSIDKDVDLVKSLVLAEWRHWVDCGRGTELFGRYRARK
jgi:SAM-dependent methyltransferase